MSTTPSSAAWFIDGAYLFKTWQQLKLNVRLDYVKLRNLLEAKYCDQASGERIDDAYYFNSDSEPLASRQNAFHSMLQYPPPSGPGLRVKLYWLHRKQLHWPAHMGGGPVLHPVSGEPYVHTTQKAVDVGLATHLLRSHSKRGWNKLFLAAGDSDFHEPVQYLVEQENVHLILIGSQSSIGTDLLPYARSVIELSGISQSISLHNAG